MPPQDEEEPTTVPADVERDEWRQRIEDALKRGGERFDAFDNRLDCQDLEIAKAVKLGEQSVEISQKTLDETQSVRDIVSGMRSLSNACAKIAGFFRSCGQFVHRCAKFLSPIVTVAAGVFALLLALLAYFKGGPPPASPPNIP